MPLFATTVVLIVVVNGSLGGLFLSLISVQVVQTLGFDQLVNFSSSKTGKKFLGKLVGNWLAFLSLLVFKKLA